MLCIGVILENTNNVISHHFTGQTFTIQLRDIATKYLKDKGINSNSYSCHISIFTKYMKEKGVNSKTLFLSSLHMKFYLTKSYVKLMYEELSPFLKKYKYDSGKFKSNGFKI